MIVGLCFALIFFFVPETFWDRTPRPHVHHKKPALQTIGGFFNASFRSKNVSLENASHDINTTSDVPELTISNSSAPAEPKAAATTIAQRRQQNNKLHVGFVEKSASTEREHHPGKSASPEFEVKTPVDIPVYISHDKPGSVIGTHLLIPETQATRGVGQSRPLAIHADSWRIEPTGQGPKTPALNNFNSPSYAPEEISEEYVRNEHDVETPIGGSSAPGSLRTEPATAAWTEKSTDNTIPTALPYTHHLRTQPPKTFSQTLRPWNGRLRHDNWFKVALRPFILFAYPSILWSTLVYSLSIGWLIVLSETVSVVYRNPDYTYKFSALGTGLVYISPFIGGILGTAVAGKLSDVIVRFMSRRNGGVYEPEFRLVMAIPVAITTCIGLMGFGWSAAVHDSWIVPTVFFGIISFGCSLGSTTAITFAVDSYRQYAGEALVTMNFSKSMSPRQNKTFVQQNAFANIPHRHLPWPDLFVVLPQLAGVRRVEVGVSRHWGYPVGVPCHYYSDVCVRQESADVDGAEEHDGEVLRWKCLHTHDAWLSIRAAFTTVPRLLIVVIGLSEIKRAIGFLNPLHYSSW